MRAAIIECTGGGFSCLLLNHETMIQISVIVTSTATWAIRPHQVKDRVGR